MRKPVHFKRVRSGFWLKAIGDWNQDSSLWWKPPSSNTTSTVATWRSSKSAVVGGEAKLRSQNLRLGLGEDHKVLGAVTVVVDCGLALRDGVKVISWFRTRV